MKKYLSLFLLLALCTSTVLYGQSLFNENESASNSISASDFSNVIQMAMSNPDYLVTPGDVYSLTYAANGVPVSYTITVDASYKLRVSNLAILDATGKSYIKLKKEVEEIVQKNYPMSGVQFVLMNPAAFKVTINGEVKAVTEKQASALTRLSSVVSGTTTGYSSLRDVTVTSANGKKRVYDLFKATRDGDLSQNPYLRPGDVVTINRIFRVVTIEGAVERPGAYELMKGENLKELIEYYGNGLTELADTTRIELVRNRDNMDAGGEKIYLSQKDIDSNFKLLNRDVISIKNKSDLLPYVTIEGIINASDAGTAAALDAGTVKDSIRTRTIKFYEGENYASLIRRYQGIFNNYSDLENSYIVRNNKNYPLNIQEIIENVLYVSPYAVEKGDTVIVPFVQRFVDVLVDGEVNYVRKEAAWPLRRLSAILEGNMTAYSSTRNVMVTGIDGKVTYYDLFKSGRDGNLEQDPYIHAGETITVQRMERKVTISGAVERPGTYELVAGDTLKDLVEYYGHGLAELADTSRIELVRSRDNMDVGGEKIYLTQKDIDGKFVLLNRDNISISSKSDLLPYIIVEGIINTSDAATANAIDDSLKDTMRRRTIKFYEGENYASLIRRYQGMFNTYSDLENSYIERGDTKIALNLQEIIEDVLYVSPHNVQRGDKLVVPFIQHFVDVLVNGEVNYVRKEAAWPLRRLSTILNGNMTTYSSTRNVMVTGVDGKISYYDLFKSGRDGNLEQDPYIHAGETITVQRMERKVTISGAVERPGTYELVAGDTLKDLVEYYGHGLAELADTSRIELVRSRDNMDVGGEKIYLTQKDIDGKFVLLNRDSISISSKSDLLPYIIVQGIINVSESDTAEALQEQAPKDTMRHRTIKFYDGENYASLIRRYQGMFNSYSDLENAYVERGDTKIALNLEEMIQDVLFVSPYNVQRGDKLVVPFVQHFVNVLVAGEVQSVHEEAAWPLRRLSTIIGDNLTEYSSTRDVLVTSVDGITTSYDLFMAGRKGDLSQNPYIRSGETITVQRMKRKVTISGAVERPGTYQLKDGENLKDLIEYYGNGLAALADLSRIEVTRLSYNNNNNKSGEKIYWNQDDVNANVELLCYDNIHIPTYRDLRPVMFMEGAIKASDTANLQTSDKQAVRFEQGTNYAYLVRAHAGWFSSSAADNEHAYIIRGNKVISVNLNQMLYDETFYSDLTVEPSDTLMVPFKQMFVSVAGAVYSPGRYPYIPDRTYEYYVGLAGGFIKEKNTLNAVEIRDIDGNKIKKGDVITPESTITAEYNSALYKFNQYSGIITTVLSLLTTSLSAYAVISSLSK